MTTGGDDCGINHRSSPHKLNTRAANPNGLKSCKQARFKAFENITE